MKQILIFALFLAAPLAGAAPLKNFSYLSKNKEVLVKFQPGKKASFQKVKIANDENPPIDPPSYLEPVRFGRLKTVIKKSVVDMTQPDPIWREEVVCTVDAPIGVYQYDENSTGTVNIEETICPTTLNGTAGELHVGGILTLLNQTGAKKVFNSWFFFLPTNPNNDDPTWYAGDSGAASTKQMDLKDLSFSLGYGFNACVITGPNEPIDPKPSPRLKDDDIGSPCQANDVVYAEFEMVDSL